ncbi:MAG TPA: DUF4278 domain-containing protein [Leptolyngbyaceae cyanobacterium M65_K2018_010]|nr:DUF4278 domain-containing protein [Leptolyngbyaceae cyanobacterium M65_K2018_010]
MQLTYRGIPYQREYPTLDLIPLPEQGQFLGARFNRNHCPGVHRPANPEQLTYRGVNYRR